MREALLAGTDVRLSVLGYGTAGFGARLTLRRRLELLHAAFEAGVTHFDTAPLYGDGSAELAVGRFAAGRRDQITLTTKVGLLPPGGGSIRRAVRAAGRRLPVRRTGGAPRAFGRADAEASVARSLRALGTGHVDLLLLHECTPDQLRAGDLSAFAEECVSRGLARAAGIATDITTARLAVSGGAPFPAVVQIAYDATEPPFAAPDRPRGLIAHSALTRDLGRLASVLGVSASDLAPVLLRAALASGPQVVLFGSASVSHIRSSAGGFDAVTQSQLDALAEAIANPSYTPTDG